MEVNTVKHEVSHYPGQAGTQPIRRATEPDGSMRRSFQRQSPVDPAPAGDPAASRTEETLDPAHSSEEPRIPEERPDEWAYRHAQLIKRERQIHAQQRQFQERERKLAEREARIRKYEELEELREKDPKAFLEKNNLSYEQLTDIYLNDGKPPVEHHIKSLQEEIQRLRDRLDNDKTESEKSWADEKITGFKRQIQGVIDNSGEQFELIQAHKAHDLVYDVIADYFQETKQILPIHEAARYVEENLLEDSKRLLGLKKLKALSEPKAPEPDPETMEAPNTRLSQPQRTIPRQQAPQQQQRPQSNRGATIYDGSYRQQLEESKRQAARMLRFNR